MISWSLPSALGFCINVNPIPCMQLTLVRMDVCLLLSKRRMITFDFTMLLVFLKSLVCSSSHSKAFLEFIS